MGIGDVVELRSKSSLILEDEGDLYAGAEIEGEAKFFAIAMVVDSGCKSGGDHKPFCDENVVAQPSADEKVCIRGHKKGSQRSDVMAIHLPAVFYLTHKSGMGSVDIEETWTYH